MTAMGGGRSGAGEVAMQVAQLLYCLDGRESARTAHPFTLATPFFC